MLKTNMWALALACLLAVGVSAGCGKKLEDKVVGKYKGEVALEPGKENDPGAAMAKALMSTLALELKEDKTFTMTIMFPLEGKWAVEGETIQLTVEKAMGMSMADLKKSGQATQSGFDKPLKLQVSDDGNTLTVIPDKPDDKSKMVFKKEK